MNVVDNGTFIYAKQGNLVKQKHLLQSQYNYLGAIIQYTVSELLQFLCSWPHPYSTLILWVFPLDQIADVGVSPSI